MQHDGEKDGKTYIFIYYLMLKLILVNSDWCLSKQMKVYWVIIAHLRSGIWKDFLPKVGETVPKPKNIMVSGNY